MLIDEACDFFGWPASPTLFNPKGKGAAVVATAVARRIGEPLKRSFPDFPLETGVLIAAPDSATTSPLLAIICQFPRGASSDLLQEVHRLAWNYSGSALLVTLEPNRLMAWSCYQDPGQSDDLRTVCELDENTNASDSNQHQVRELLHWVSLITGELLRRKAPQFPSNGRADRLLLKNLRHVRRQLIDSKLPSEICHDLLARTIFTQFLFHRKDSAGKPFFNDSLLGRLADDGTLQLRHANLSSILNSKDETYALFRWMDDRFNGDLFPHKDDSSDSGREAAWQAEKDAVSEEHLQQISRLVSGTIDTTDRQLRLWPQYSFDTIPLEFISSVYEEFLNEDRGINKAYYTPSHLVDYVLDAVLPWDGDEWNLRILDPSSGSGIFLVKAFQRLIHRWRIVHHRDPLVSDLKPILANNFVGVDINPNAVRVACFSLYLAMADAIDPKHYVTRDKVFPRLRGTRLIARDFFAESTEGFCSQADGGTFDLVIGNAPWGDGSIKDTSDIAEIEETKKKGKKKSLPSSKAEVWANKNDWPIANHDIGPLFVAKGLKLINDSGRVAMLQPAAPWLYQRENTALALRKRLFTNFTVDEITNLSAVRRELFSDVIGPACAIVVGRSCPSGDNELYYFSPKPSRISSESTELRIEPQDVSRISHSEAASDPLVWTVLSLGGHRDARLIHRLCQQPNLTKLKAEGKVLTRMGVIPGDRKKLLPDLKGKPYFEQKTFPDDVFLELDADSVSKWEDPRVHSLHGIANYEEFKNPQLLIKQSFSAKLGRFRAALVKSSDPEWGVVCKKTYMSVRDCSADGHHLGPICLTYNSSIATYFLFLTSSRFGHYITEVNTLELMEVPLPLTCADISSINTFEEIDQLIRKSFGLTEADWILIDDMLNVALIDAIRKEPGPGRKQTTRKASKTDIEPELTNYGQTLIRVLKSTFGVDKSIACTIYQESDSERLPVRMLTLHLDCTGKTPVTVEPMAVDGLLDELGQFHREVLKNDIRSATGEGIGFQRVAFLVHTQKTKSGRERNITIIKPDEYRYWTRSQAMRDADELAASIMKAGTKGAKR